MKDTKPQIQEAERNPDRINAIGKKQKTKNVRHIIVKLLLEKSWRQPERKKTSYTGQHRLRMAADIQQVRK